MSPPNSVQMLCFPNSSRGRFATLLLLLFGFGLLIFLSEVPQALRWPSRILGVLAGAIGLCGILWSLRHGFYRLTEGLRDSMGAWDRILIAILLVQHGVMFWNSAVHDPTGNPDWRRHWDSVRAWSEGRMVEAEESRGIYYAPLAYWPPAVAHAMGLSRYGATRLGMLLGVVYSLVVILYMLRLCRMLTPDSQFARRMAASFVALLPLWYKSCAMQRPEPMLAALCMAAMFYGARIFWAGDRKTGLFVKFGAAMGLALLARQWAIFILPAFIVGLGIAFKTQQKHFVELLAKLILSVGVALLIAGWFYAALHVKHGSAFTGPTAMRPGAIKEKSWEFYADLHPEIFFHRPVAWALGNRFWPIFISEIFGDYYGYWWHPRVGQGMEHDYSEPAYQFAEHLGWGDL